MPEDRLALAAALTAALDEYWADRAADATREHPEEIAWQETQARRRGDKAALDAIAASRHRAKTLTAPE